MRVRVLYLQPAASYGGAERQAAQTIARLPRFGIDVEPLVGPGQRIVQFLEDAGVHNHVLSSDYPDDPPTPDALANLVRIGDYIRCNLKMIQVIRREARRTRCDVVLASRPFAWVTGGMAARPLGVPVVWRAGTAFTHWAQPRMLAPYARRWPPAAVIYNSWEVLRSITPAVSAPHFVIPNGVDTDRFRAGRPLPSLRRALGIADDVPVVCFAARLAPEKGLDLLVEVAGRLKASVPGVRMLVAGDSSWRPQLEARLARAHLGDTVCLLGYVREVERVYAAADVVLSTSVVEWCSNTILEAMAMGCAVVATRVGGTREIIREGVDGLLIHPPAGSAAADMASAVAMLLHDPQRRGQMGAAAAQRVRTIWSSELQVARVAQVLRWAAGASSSPSPPVLAPNGPAASLPGAAWIAGAAPGDGSSDDGDLSEGATPGPK